MILSSICCDKVNLGHTPPATQSQRWTRRCCLLAFLLASLISRDSAATAQTIQQPVIGNFGVQTSVVVPDRGGVYLGGVKRAGESSFHSTFSPFGSSIGLFREHTGLSAHVWISDMQEMDELILQAADRPDGRQWLRDIHSGVAFQDTPGLRGGAIAIESPLSGRMLNNQPTASGRKYSGIRNHYGAVFIPFRPDGRPDTRQQNQASRVDTRVPNSPQTNTALASQSNDFLDQLAQRLDNAEGGKSNRQAKLSTASGDSVREVYHPGLAKLTKQKTLPRRETKLAASRAYMLGRRAEKAGDRAEAIKQYQRASRMGSNPATNRLEEIKLSAIAQSE